MKHREERTVRALKSRGRSKNESRLLKESAVGVISFTANLRNSGTARFLGKKTSPTCLAYSRKNHSSRLDYKLDDVNLVLKLKHCK